ncbi:hypothetical protein [Lacipirellula parvula]|uniref:Spheroidene monooxygenase n=1 Tax=Lacipirellula parvula TaxID=2650471 RepID=A0A5K7X907_9BACT|nr:hypothetical protein [Lacipirellula parvula]BBO30913.1 hypothetical protein PLANPX_0525 [Lacipirellula parvula]
MQIFSFHLARTTPATTAGAMCRPLTNRSVAGLRHAECMAAMTLGSPILSPARMQLRSLAVFASWESEAALDAFLAETKLGRTLAAGWHVRLSFLRQWGRFAELGELPANIADADPAQPVVTVTLARLKLPQLARFIRWGKPVEKLVRDHPGATLALAAFRPPRTFSTFSVWRSQREMTEMVHGRGSLLDAGRHAAAMAERNRKDFHFQFTTLRFRAIAEHGEWAGRSGIVPQ